MRQGWISEEARLWKQLMDTRSYYVRRPSGYELSKLNAKNRAKRMERYRSEVARQHARSWINYDAFIRHMPP